MTRQYERLWLVYDDHFPKYSRVLESGLERRGRNWV